MQDLDPADVRFIVQQDGPPERDFTAKLSVFFEQVNANLKAYLCRVHYGDPNQVSVAICLASPDGQQMALVNGASQIFRETFGAHEHIDIMFIGADQMVTIEKVCQPFYSNLR